MVGDKGERWLLPSGVEESLPREAFVLEQARRKLIDLFCVWGYELVEPPFIEYLESLLTGVGGDLDLQTFKLIDQLTGRLMGVRADMTPQVARIDAHRLTREGTVRLCYLGTVLHTLPDDFSASRSPLQVGAELYGHGGIESDCEVLCLMLETLAATGLERVHVDIGHVGVFRALARQADLDPGQETTLFDTLQRKARPELEELLAEWNIRSPLAAALLKLLDLNGDESVLQEARGALGSAAPDIGEALSDLERLARALTSRVEELPLHFDLAELRGYRYHTGVVFSAFVAGHGQDVARGGRYDGVGEVFGRARPATGFSTDLKTLTALGKDCESARAGLRGIAAPWCDDRALQAAVRERRAKGETVIYGFAGEAPGEAGTGCDRQLVKEGGRWVVTKLAK